MPEPGPPRPALDDACLALFRASALLDPMRLRIWDSEGLTVTQLRLLIFLDQEQELTNAELADRLYITRPSVSALLGRLKRGGFLVSRIDPRDRRSWRLSLTGRGKEAVANLSRELMEFTTGLFQALDDAALCEITGSLQRLVEAGRAARAAQLAEGAETPGLETG